MVRHGSLFHLNFVFSVYSFWGKFTFLVLNFIVYGLINAIFLTLPLPPAHLHPKKVCSRGCRDVIIDIHCQMLYVDFPILVAIFAQAGPTPVLLLIMLTGRDCVRVLFS